MQTFLPSSNFTHAAQALDNKRLNKQILEAYQILNTLSGQSVGWRNHPAVKMWEDHEHMLYLYAQAMVEEAKLRGIKTENNESNLNKLLSKFGNIWGKSIPSWFNDDKKMMRVVTTHRANLFIKDPIYYARYQYATKSIYNQPCCDTCKYFWVTHPRKAIVKKSL